MVLVLDSNGLLYDRKVPSGVFRARERIAKGLAGSPKVVVVNAFELNQIPEKEDKIKHLTEKCGLQQVADSVNYEEFNQVNVPPASEATA